jgi:hypothetical protein
MAWYSGDRPGGQLLERYLCGLFYGICQGTQARAEDDPYLGRFGEASADESGKSIDLLQCDIFAHGDFL